MRSSMFKWLGNMIRKDASTMIKGALLNPNSGQQQLPPFSNTVAIELAKSWCWIAGNMNANVIASTPLRLFSRRTTGMGMPKLAAYKRLNKREESELAEVYAESDDTDIVEITEHPFLDLMKNVNRFRNQFDFIQESVLFELFTGNAYWLVERGQGLQAGIPTELWCLPADKMTIVPDENTFIKGYLYGQQGRQMVLTVDQVIHHREPNIRDLFYGMGRIEAGYYAISGMRAYQEFEVKTAKNPIPAMVGVIKHSLSPEQIREYQYQFDSMMNDAARRQSNLMGIETTDIEFKPLSIPPRDMAFLQGRQWNREEIVNLFGQSMALFTDSPSRANVDGSLYRWAKFELDPFCVRLSQKINEKLLPMYDDPTLFCAFDSICKEDEAFLLSQQVQHVQNKIRSINEVRVESGYPPLDDPRADDVFYAPETLNPFGGAQDVSADGEESLITGDGKNFKGYKIHPHLKDATLRVN